jgi:hypothetical protein
MFKLYYLILELIRFSRESRAFLAESERLIEQDPEAARASRRTYRRILWLAALFPVVCGLIVPMTIPCVALYQGTFKGPALGMTFFIGILLSLLASFIYLFAGVAVGCLLAPDEFYDSPAGGQWLKLIGTNNRTTARVVCFVLAVAGLAIMVGICAVEAVTLHAPALNR